MTPLKQVLNNIFSNWTTLIIGMIVSFFLAPFIVQKLGNIYYGIWALLMELTGYLYLLDFGVRESIIRYVSKNIAQNKHDDNNDIINASFIIYGGLFIISCAASFIFCLLVPFLFQIESQYLGTARIAILITGMNVSQVFIFNVFVGLIMAVQRYDIFNKVHIIFIFVRLLLVVYFLKNGYGIIALATIQFSIDLCKYILFFLFSKKLVHFKLQPIPFSKSLVHDFQKEKKLYNKLINYSFFVFINNIGQKLIFYTDAMVIGFFLGPAQITFYAIAGNLIEYLRRFIMVMAQVFNPLSSEMDSLNRKDQLKQILLNGTRFSFFLSLPVCLSFIVLGDTFISLWMGTEYALYAYPVLLVLTITNIASVPHYTISSKIYGIGLTNNIAICRMLEAGFNFLLSIILVKYYGIVGVAIGTAVPHMFIVLIVLPILICKTLDQSLLDYIKSAYLPPLASSIVFLIGTLIVKYYTSPEGLVEFFFYIFLNCLFYIASIISFGISAHERNLLFRFLRMGLQKRK